MRTISLLIISLIFILTANELSFSQIQSIKSKADDAFKELENSSLTLRFINALNGKSIPDADVAIENVGVLATDFEGKVLFNPPFNNGQLTVEFTCKGYVTSAFKIDIMAGSLFFNRFSISPNLLQGAIRIVLDWEQEPKDLDAHLMKQGAYHISYRDMRASADGKATLDHDATNGYGPETITVNSIDSDGKYEFFVHNFSGMHTSNSKGLSESKACVKIYSSTGLIKMYQVPTDQSGLYWKVFRIENSEIVDMNEISNRGPE
jgi:hypothetical protein